MSQDIRPRSAREPEGLIGIVPYKGVNIIVRSFSGHNASATYRRYLIGSGIYEQGFTSLAKAKEAITKEENTTKPILFIGD